jgi:hypothetical protein
MDVLPQDPPSVYKKYPDREKSYLFDLLTGSERSIPKNNLTYLGNIPGDDIYPYSERSQDQKYHLVGSFNSGAFWKYFESTIITRYLRWEENGSS